MHSETSCKGAPYQSNAHWGARLWWEWSGTLPTWQHKDGSLHDTRTTSWEMAEFLITQYYFFHNFTEVYPSWFIEEFWVWNFRTFSWLLDLLVVLEDHIPMNYFELRYFWESIHEATRYFTAKSCKDFKLEDMGLIFPISEWYDNINTQSDVKRHCIEIYFFRTSINRFSAPTWICRTFF